MSYKIVFFGSSSYSTIILQKLLTLSQFQIVATVTKIDKPIGRDQTITQNPVASFASSHHLPLIQVEEFTPEFDRQITNLSPDLALCVAFGPPFFGPNQINSYPHGIINIHPSPLPRYRGATPGPWQIINGETTSAVTFFLIDQLPDHGPIISAIPFNIDSQETSESFYLKAFNLAADHLETTLHNFLTNPTSVQVQDHSQKSYFPKLTKESGRIDWTWDQEKIRRFVNALLPWPVAWTQVKNQSGEVLNMKIFSYNHQPVEVQIQGKTKTTWEQIKNYYRII